MTDKERMALGAIGGVLVGFIGYPLTGYESITALEEGIYLAVGLIFRVLFFAFFGGLWAYLHRSENDRLKIFQLGLLGPAIISAMVHANTSKVEVTAEDVAALQLPALISSAYAQSTSTPTPTSPQPTPWVFITRGLLGTSVVK